MILNRGKLYSIMLIACIAGYIWTYCNIKLNLTDNKSVTFCVIKHATNIPCPSCGSTRSIIALINGKFAEAFYLNPIGYIVAIIMLIAPVWIFLDLVSLNDSLFNCYQKIEHQIKKAKYSVPLILIVIINWIWNIKKGL